MPAQQTYTEKQWRHTQYASYFGYITQAIVNNLAPLLFLIFQDVYQIPLEQITLLVTVNFCFQLFIDVVAARFVDKIGYRPCIVAAHLFAAAGLVGLGVFPRLLPVPFFGLLGAVLLYAVGGGLIEVLVSPIVEACPTKNKASVMSLLHSFYCWGSVGVILISTLFLQVFGKGSWTLLAVLWALLPLCNAFVFAKVPIGRLTEEGEGLSMKKLFGSKLFWILAALMFASGASELSMSQWASAFAESGLGVTKTVGDLAGPCFFAVLMGCARVIYAKFGDRLNLLNVEILSALLCVVSYLLAALSPVPALALLGCGLCGFSVGVMWPGTISVAARHLPKGGTAMFALLALFGDLGCSGGPTLVGMVSGAMGGALKTGLLVAVLFPVLLIVAALVCKQALRRRETSR
ncbi:MAG: MFS transporter [Acutalibacter sp.]|jgi:fucose permease